MYDFTDNNYSCKHWYVEFLFSAFDSVFVSFGARNLNAFYTILDYLSGVVSNIRSA